MRIPRLYHPDTLAAGSVIEISDSAANYLGKVLRLKAGHPVVLFNGQGGEFRAELLEVGKRRVSVQVGEHLPRETESPLDLTLVQAVSKGERMDFTLQKAVELGVSRFIPVFSERSVVNLKGERLERRMEHWQGVMISACEQSGRNRLPELLEARTLGHWLTEPLPDSALGLLLQPESTVSLKSLQRPTDKAILLVGPEGGFSTQEIDAAITAGYQGVVLGPRILRTETAGLAALAAMQLLWGDLG